MCTKLSIVGTTAGTWEYFGKSLSGTYTFTNISSLDVETGAKGVFVM